jgi:tetratricopeptide (TPR) repeat protein
MRRTQMWLWGTALAAAGAIAPALYGQAAPAAAAAPAAPADAQVQPHAGLFEVAAVLGRQKAQSLEGPARRGPRPVPGAASYQAGLAFEARDQTDSAVAAFSAAVRADSNVARYRGDLAFAFAAAGKFDQAVDEYRAAFRLQGTNAWYAVGLGACQMALQQWSQAAASFSLAVSTDSAVIIKPLIGPAGDAFYNAGMRQASEDWSRMAVARFPDEAMPWLRLASYAYMHRDSAGVPDTAAGLPVIRRYRVLHPDDHAGEMLYAEYLLVEGQADSAAVLAMAGAADTANRVLASSILLKAGVHFIRQHKFDSATVVLEEGRPMAPAQHLSQFDLTLGMARLPALAALFNDAASHSDCSRARLVDTMLTSITAQVTAGAQADSATANVLLGRQIPQFRAAIDNFKKSCGS